MIGWSDLIEPARISSFWAALATHIFVSLALAIDPLDQDLSWRFGSFVFVLLFSIFVSPLTYVCFFAGTALIAVATYNLFTRYHLLNRTTATVLGAASSTAAALILAWVGFGPADWTYIAPIAGGGAIGGWSYARSLKEQATRPPPARPCVGPTP